MGSAGATDRGGGLGKRAVFRFYAELNDFLPAARRQVAFEWHFQGGPAVKDAVESLGVPHTEVDLILVNGRSVGFDHLLQDGDRVSVYPVFESLDITPLLKVRPEPLRTARFVLDIHLGKLAGYLRMLGFDTLYRNDFDDRTLARISAEERRILLTRDLGLLKRSQVSRGYWLRSSRPREQLKEVVRRFQLAPLARPFSRCIRCNGELEAVAKAEVEAELEPETRRAFQRFRRCRACGKVYWRGSHFERMDRLVREVLAEG